jgi:tRNA-2-methylthio-N6-dimethylallyladenosine synthase
LNAQRHCYLWNIGCQMNRADAARLGEALEQRGYAPTSQPEAAELLILNTCVVRQSAEDKVTGRLNSLQPLKHDGTRRALLVMGCFVEADTAALAARYPFVDVFLKPSDLAGALAFVDAWERAGGCAEVTPRDSDTPVGVAENVPISYGCDHHCTYCIVAIRRGAERSRPLDEIVAEVERLVQRGAREVTLLGQNVDSYGHDLPGHPDLADLLSAIHPLEGLWRIRFLTSHPQEMTPRIIATASALPKVCLGWELPVQAGDDAVLKCMGRGYTVARYHELVARMRAAQPACSINTDIIFCFPGETAEQFQRTLELVQ